MSGSSPSPTPLPAFSSAAPPENGIPSGSLAFFVVVIGVPFLVIGLLVILVVAICYWRSHKAQCEPEVEYDVYQQDASLPDSPQPDSSALAGTVANWHSPLLARTMNFHTDKVVSLHFNSFNSTLLMSASEDSRVFLSDITDSSIKCTIELPSAYVQCAQVSPGVTSVAVGDTKALSIYRARLNPALSPLRAGEALDSSTEEHPDELGYDFPEPPILPDYDEAAEAFGQAAVSLLRSSSPSSRHSPRSKSRSKPSPKSTSKPAQLQATPYAVLVRSIHPAPLSCLRYLSESQVVTGCLDGYCRVFDANAAKQIGEWHAGANGLSHDNFVTSMCATRRTPTLSESTFLAGDQDGCVRLWDCRQPAAPALEFSHAHDADIACMDLSPNEQCFASASSDCSLKLFDFRTQRCELATFSHRSMVQMSFVAFHPSGSYLYATSNNTVAAFQINSKSMVWSTNLLREDGMPEKITAAAASRQQLALASASGVRVFSSCP